ncbi:hypothetical protein HS088_TW21G01309 [Tripterygium wilfordii]|uniref:Uncharacterized protein n=1 Tax=Tripterygium wilfordii TaxID=458696 RepID=A0A7J7C4U4_TRIWF|nr:hypothetical protein HS088_TW21G01309 [Tripterygium wilfordii]
MAIRIPHPPYVLSSFKLSFSFTTSTGLTTLSFVQNLDCPFARKGVPAVSSPGG